MDDGIAQAEALNNIAYTYFVMGDTQQAIETCFKSRAIYKAIGDLRREGEVINNIGSLFLRTGDTRQAICSEPARRGL